MASTVIIFPEPADRLKELAKELLELADNGRDVEYVSWPEPGFRVPEDLFVRYAATREKSEAAGEAVEEQPSEPVKKKPGRPKKEVQSNAD